jgi:hypothetical protein
VTNHDCQGSFVGLFETPGERFGGVLVGHVGLDSVNVVIVDPVGRERVIDVIADQVGMDGVIDMIDDQVGMDWVSGGSLIRVGQRRERVVSFHEGIPFLLGDDHWPMICCSEYETQGSTQDDEMGSLR